MSVTNGQKANQTTFNNAFMSRTVDTSTTGKVALNNATTSTIADAQKAINRVMTASGANLTDTGIVYSAPTSTITDGDDHELALSKLAEKFDPATGHSHSGADGDGGPIAAGDIQDVPLAPYYVESPLKTAVTGASLDVSTDLSGYSESSSSTTPGIVTSAPSNVALIRKSGGVEDGKPLFASGREVYGRITKALSVWTLTFYTNISGTETAYTILASTDFKYYPLQLESPLGMPLVYPNTVKLLLDAGGGGSGGGGGGGSLNWLEQANAPEPLPDNGMLIYNFSEAALEQELFTIIKVPSTYAGGTPIKLRSLFYSAEDSGDAQLFTESTLIRKQTDAVSSTTNQRTSTNAARTLSGATVNEPQVVEFDLTDSTGKINGVSVSANDLIKIRLYRDSSDTVDGALYAPVYGSEVTFS